MVRRAAQVKAGGCDGVLVMVTCPDRREHLYEKTLQGLLDVGFKVDQVRRRRGVDMNLKSKCKGPKSHKLPPNLDRSTFLMWDFHKGFLPSAIAAFESDSSLQVVFWAEDDVQVGAGVDAAALKRQCLLSPSAMAWLGYVRRNGVPWYGAHLLGVTRRCSARLREHLDAMSGPNRRTSSSTSHLVSLDCWVRRMQEVTVRGKALCLAAPMSMARQRVHGLIGRR